MRKWNIPIDRTQKWIKKWGHISCLLPESWSSKCQNLSFFVFAADDSKIFKFIWKISFSPYRETYGLLGSKLPSARCQPLQIQDFGIFCWLSCFLIFLVRCANWYHLYNFKKVKITHGGVLILVKLQVSTCNFTEINTPPWVFFTILKLNKWYQIAQRTTTVNISQTVTPRLLSQTFSGRNQEDLSGALKYFAKAVTIFLLSENT